MASRKDAQFSSDARTGNPNLTNNASIRSASSEAIPHAATDKRAAYTMPTEIASP
jgi:hypothetical protein